MDEFSDYCGRASPFMAFLCGALGVEF